MNPLLELIGHGQSYWLDNLTRDMIANGALARRVADEGLRGITSNPDTFSKAIGHGDAYDEQIMNLLGQGPVPAVGEIYEELATTDVRNACDILRPVFDESDGVDGYVSLEVSPHLAHDAKATVAEGRRLWERVGRPNLFIKVPGTVEGLPAIEGLLFEGINVNVTLLFSVTSYQAVAEAHMRALERRAADGRPLDRVASVASFFLSRIDVLVDNLLVQRLHPLLDPTDVARIRGLVGKVGVANAKIAYRRFTDNLSSGRWSALSAKGARPQRMLWASTSTKNPAYPDLMYVEPLIGPETVNTMPEKTIAAFREHGHAAPTVGLGVEEASRTMAELERLDIDFDQVARQLENEGVQKFIDPFDELITGLDRKTALFAARSRIEPLKQMGQKLRRLTIEMTTAAGSGHPTSCMSCADIVAALFFHEMRWDPSDPRARNVDTFILSKGHAAPILWAALSEAAAIDEGPMTLRRIDSTLEGHPTPANPWVRVSTGSLGQGLSAANGIALANRLDGLGEARVYCLMGDGELSEGSVWEAAQFASLEKIRNVVAIVDMNALAQSDFAPYRHDTDVIARRFASFGWRTIEIDGHDMGQILDAFFVAREGGPVAIVARTEKGKGVSFLEGAEGFHGKPLDDKQKQKALDELGPADIRLQVEPRRVGRSPEGTPPSDRPIEVRYAGGAEAATRNSFGEALAKLGDVMPDLVVLDGDVRNSTGTDLFRKRHPRRFFEGYIAEQNATGVALGLASCGKVAVFATFASFLSRAYDFIRMAGHSRPKHLVFCGSHAGVSIGEDGPSQMGLEDLAMFRAMAQSTVFYPCDGVSAERLTEQAVRTEGVVYVRTTRGKTPVIYGNEEEFAVGGSKLLRHSDKDRFTIVAAGITVHEALAANEMLADDGIPTRVIDAYSVKPLDREALFRAAHETEAVLVVEDHYADGGLGDAVASLLAGMAPVHKLAITQEPHSGTPEQLLSRYGISRDAIARTVHDLARSVASHARPSERTTSAEGRPSSVQPRRS